MNYAFIKINKRYRNGKTEHILPIDRIDGELPDEDFIKDTVENWCDNDEGGRVYGYSVEYEIIEDPLIIKKELETFLISKQNAIKHIMNSIRMINEDIDDL